MKIEDYIKYYMQGSDHYLIPKDVFIELFEEMENWKEEAKELKKQLENYKRLGFKHLADKNNNLETQQKEFINYLEKRYKDVTSVIGSFGSNTDLLYGKKYILEEILQKYKEITGKLH